MPADGGREARYLFVRVAANPTSKRLLHISRAFKTDGLPCAAGALPAPDTCGTSGSRISRLHSCMLRLFIRRLLFDDNSLEPAGIGCALAEVRYTLMLVRLSVGYLLAPPTQTFLNSLKHQPFSLLKKSQAGCLLEALLYALFFCLQ